MRPVTKKISQLRNLFTVCLIVEIVLLCGIYVVLPSKPLFILVLYIMVKNIIVFGCMMYTGYVLDRNALSVSEALSSDASNALIFGGVGLIMYDDNRNITWVSDLLLAMNINIVGVKLLEWQPTLAGLFEDEDIRLIDVKGKKFEAYNAAGSHLIYLKDVTQYVGLEQDYTDQQMCLGYLTIDNYEETLQNVDEPKAAQIQGICRQVIVDWAYNNGMIIRRYKTGSYMLFFNERIYKKLVENKFDILDTFKKACLELDEVITLSIGIGRGTRVLGELDQLASQALRLTYSRGGDQVAIKSGKDRVRFFGGRSDTMEKSSKVRARVIAQTLAGIIRRSSNVYVMGHKFSDLDSFGASIGMARIVQAYDKKVNIIYDPESLEDKTAGVAELVKKDERYKGLLVSYSEVLEYIDKDSLLILVDHHKPSLSISNVMLEKVKNKVVIDHHRRGEEFIDSPILTYLEPSASSTVELIIELCSYETNDIHFNDFDATIMYSGILVDTNQFRQRVGVRTFQSAARLKEMSADVIRAYEFLEDSFAKTVEIIKITESAYQFKNDILIAHSNDNEEHAQVTLAKASNRLLNVSNVKAAFTVGRVAKNKVAISARSSRDINVQMIMELMGGGGHFTMAACQLEDVSVDQATQQLENAINQYLDERGE
ncbi:DHH family phosphoesterase [Intestinibaculum porci]|uniref:DHH family phosphoesterase n=1 Tax=Intestinibaculum porci TaxID=2487118 RepID=UPI001E2C7031|nr:DHH family phosphoesterase [Intestinibaculum porci]MDD6348638.1 DHH family phosphoesterase [Intestinibaculum porci]MDD6423728.1 DHH family phosphoesterase [Intestinibaculum porci]